jgi:glycosyltransferase involved in cell wall biosynthesis
LTRLLFVYDHRFYRGPAGEVCTSGSLPAHVWSRYLDHFDSIEVLSRDGGPAPNSDLADSSHTGVTFNLIEGLTTFRQQIFRPRNLDARIRSSVACSSAALIRLPSELGFLAAAECRRIGKPYAIEVVGCAWDGMFNHGSLLGRLYAPLFYLRTRRAVRHAPLALYVTSKWLQSRYPTDGISYAASDVEIAPLTEPEASGRQERLQLIAKGRLPRLGTVASLRIRSKGIHIAIAAIGALRREGLDLTYRVLGPGDPEPWRRLAARHGVDDLVSFDGVRAAGEGVRAWLDKIDIHLQPSFQEGLPRATIEAMSRGVACVGSTCGGIPELIPAERTHRPGDARTLAAIIRSLATDPSVLAAAAATDLQTAQSYLPQNLRRRRSEFYGALRAMAGQARS